MTEDQLTINMARLAAGLRKSVPVSDQWQVSLVNLSAEAEAPWRMVEMCFSREVEGRTWHYVDYLSPAMLADPRVQPEWIGEYRGRKWLEKAANATAAAHD